MTLKVIIVSILIIGAFLGFCYYFGEYFRDKAITSSMFYANMLQMQRIL